MTLVSENVYADIFARVPLGCGVRWQWGCGRRQFSATLMATCYFYGNFRDKTITITWRYATPCRPEIRSKMNDLQWPWVPTWSLELLHVKILFRTHELARLSSAYLSVS